MILFFTRNLQDIYYHTAVTCALYKGTEKVEVLDRRDFNEDFGKKSVLRNPNIANLLHRAGYIEKMGTGINKMRRLVAEAGLPPIVFEFGTFFTATFRRPTRIEPIVFDERGGVFGGVFGGINEKVAERMGKVIKALCGGQLNISQLTVMTGIPKRTLERDIALLKDKGFVAFEGAPKTGRYVLAEKGKKMIKELKG